MMVTMPSWWRWRLLLFLQVARLLYHVNIVPDNMMTVYCCLATRAPGILSPFLYVLTHSGYTRAYEQILCSVSSCMCGCPITHQQNPEIGQLFFVSVLFICIFFMPRFAHARSVNLIVRSETSAKKNLFMVATQSPLSRTQFSEYYSLYLNRCTGT